MATKDRQFAGGLEDHARAHPEVGGRAGRIERRLLDRELTVDCGKRPRDVVAGAREPGRPSCAAV